MYEPVSDIDSIRTSRECRELLAEISERGAELYNQAKAAGREFTAAETSELEIMTSQGSPIRARLDELERIDEATKREARNIVQFANTNNPASSTPLAARTATTAPATPQPNLRTSKLRAFKSDGDAFRSGMWLRAFVSEECHGRPDPEAKRFCESMGWQVRNAGTEGSGPAGGYLVPAPLSQTIIDVREDVGVARRVCQIMPMTSDTLSIPKRDSGLTVYYGGENPSSDMTASDKSWKQLNLVAKKRYVVHQISQELVDDALIAVVDDAALEMAYALADKEDAEFISGDGTSTYGLVTGLKSAIGSAGVYTAGAGDDTWDELAMVDFTGTMGKLPSRFQRDTSWICSSEFYHTVMLRVAAEAGGNSMVNLLGGPDGSPAFLGRPVYFTSEMPTTTAASTVACFYGAFNLGCIIGDRTGVRLARSDDFAFLRDLTTLKATSRYDLNVHYPGDASDVGCFAGLSTNS